MRAPGRRGRLGDDRRPHRRLPRRRAPPVIVATSVVLATTKVWWYTARSAGLVAWALAALAVLWVWRCRPGPSAASPLRRGCSTCTGSSVASPSRSSVSISWGWPSIRGRRSGYPSSSCPWRRRGSRERWRGVWSPSTSCWRSRSRRSSGRVCRSASGGVSTSPATPCTPSPRCICSSPGPTVTTRSCARDRRQRRGHRVLHDVPPHRPGPGREREGVGPPWRGRSPRRPARRHRWSRSPLITDAGSSERSE